jgi:DNA-binding transcriptional MerR regulator
MDRFTISQLSRFSGIKPHTIRIWERRYNALKPKRSKGNTRYYDGSQLRRLLNIVSLMESDYKVSDLGSMPDEKLFKLLHAAISENKEQADYYIAQLISAGMSFNEAHFEKVFSHCLLRYGLKEAYVQMLCPMLERIGLLWSANNIPPAQEHFISHLVRQKILTAIDSLPPAVKGDPWLLFLPEEEYHEIGLLFASYLLRSSGKRCIYLGPDVPLSSVKSTIATTRPSHLLFFMVHFDEPQRAQQYLEKMKASFSKKIFIAGNIELISQLKLGSRIQWLSTTAELENIGLA